MKSLQTPAWSACLVIVGCASEASIIVLLWDNEQNLKQGYGSWIYVFYCSQVRARKILVEFDNGQKFLNLNCLKMGAI